MALGFVALILLIFFAGDKIPSGVLWPILLGACLLSHIWMMRRGHATHTPEDASASNADETKQEAAQSANDEHTKGGGHRGCCG